MRFHECSSRIMFGEEAHTMANLSTTTWKKLKSENQQKKRGLSFFRQKRPGPTLKEAAIDVAHGKHVRGEKEENLMRGRDRLILSSCVGTHAPACSFTWLCSLQVLTGSSKPH